MLVAPIRDTASTLVASVGEKRFHLEFQIKSNAPQTMIPRSVVLFFVELEFGPFTAAGTAQRYWHNAVHVEQQNRYPNRDG